jgi:hypothetical protein
MPTPPTSSPPPLLTVRTALVLLLGLVCGVAAALLTAMGGSHLPAAALIGLGTAGGATAFFHKVIA